MAEVFFNFFYFQPESKTKIINKERKKYLSKADIQSKLEYYCAYQDRCHKEVEQKLRDYGADRDQSEDILLHLIKEDFLNEERYAQSYARGKFRMKKWGRMKIRTELKKNRLSDYCIRKGMEEIDEEEYLDCLINLISKKNRESKVSDLFIRRRRISEFLIRKGYEPDIVWRELKDKVRE